MKIVISQSIYFPWVGLLEQVRLAEKFVHYDDVQFARGFYNRVQVKTSNGIKWLTVPLRNQHRGQHINEVQVDDRIDWRSQHRDILKQAYRSAPYCKEMLEIVDQVFAMPYSALSDVSRNSLLALADYFNLSIGKTFIDSSVMNIPGSSSQRLHDICLALAADTYITGHGALNYLDHHLFDQSNISVQYMKYQMQPYQQLHGDFTPYVSGLDLVANCGQDGARVIRSDSVYWKKFISELN